jgi:endonuclease/exonuclease/phosphatase family metal-dependent hydrolase
VTVNYDAGYGELLDTTVRIATWNVWGRYAYWAERLPVIIETLQRTQPDIVCLQEAWEHPGEARSQADEVGAALGYAPAPVYAHNLEWPDGTRSGNAVLSRWPIARHDTLVLPRVAGDFRDDEHEERLCVGAEVDGPRGPIQVFCAHLSWRGDHSAIRVEQARAIAGWLREWRPRSFPAVLCGDLNAGPDSNEIRMLTGTAAPGVPGVWFRDAWADRHPGDPGFTWSNANPFAAASLDHDHRIDYVMTGAPKASGCGHVVAIDVIGHEPIGGMYGSDHFGLVATLRY